MFSSRARIQSDGEESQGTETYTVDGEETTDTLLSGRRLSEYHVSPRYITVSNNLDCRQSDYLVVFFRLVSEI